MTGYEVTIVNVSKDIDAIERVQLKDTTDAIKLDKATTEGAVIINLDYFAELQIHNDKAEDKEYATYVLVDKDGTKYVTGSPSLWSSFTNINKELAGSDIEWGIKVYRAPSKNREGKDFLTCAVVKF